MLSCLIKAVLSIIISGKFLFSGDHMASDVNIFIALLAGLLSFLSPCVLPLVPAYLAFLSGEATALDPDQDKRVKWKIFIQSLAFVGGFSLIFILLGLSATFIGSFILDYKDIITKIGGVLIIIFGLSMTGILKTPLAYIEKRFDYKVKGEITLLKAFIFGIVFAAGWTPCIGPILGSILVLASTEGSVLKGGVLLAFYSLGLGIPFLLAGLAINSFRSTIQKFNSKLNLISIIAGVLMIVLGILLLTGQLSVISAWFKFVPDFTSILKGR